MERRCTACGYPGYPCETCPITINYWTSLPAEGIDLLSGFTVSASGTSGLSERRIREIVKEELAKSQKNSGIVGTIKIEADVDSFKEAAECIKTEAKTKGLSFSQAFEIIRNDSSKGMRLPFWSPEVVIKVQNHDANFKMTHPYLYADSRKGKVPWRETFPELFSCEWEIVG